MTTLKIDVTKAGWKSILTKNWYWENGTKLTVVMTGTFTSTTFTTKALKHSLHSFWVMQGGRYDALILKTTSDPKFTAPFADSWIWSGMKFLQMLGLLEEPPLQNHPFSSVHWLLQPSPSLVFPSSHCCSNLIPSPHIYSQFTKSCPATFSFFSA